MFDYAQAYHHGVRVPDLDVAMKEVGEALGIAWCEPQDREQRVWLPGVGTTSIPLRFTYSAAGPHHLELIEGAPGTIWDGRDQPGVHHIGVWCDDVGGETERLTAARLDGAARATRPRARLWRVLVRSAPQRPDRGAGVERDPPDVRAVVRRRPARLNPVRGWHWETGVQLAL